MMGMRAWERLLAKAQGISEANPRPPARHVILQMSASTVTRALVGCLCVCASFFTVFSALLWARHPYYPNGRKQFSNCPTLSLRSHFLHLCTISSNSAEVISPLLFSCWVKINSNTLGPSEL